MERPPRPLCVVTTQRSGSTWFMQQLGNLDGIRPFGELFQGLRSKDYIGDIRLKSSLTFADWLDMNGGSFQPFRASRYLEALEGVTEGRIAFQLMYNQIKASPECFFSPAIRRYSFIHLVRKDYLSCVISRALAGRTGVFHSSEPLDYKPIHLPVSSVMAQIRHLDMLVRFASIAFKFLPNPVLTLNYETLLANTETQMRQVAKFLNANYAIPSDNSRDWRKMNTKPPVELLENFEEIRSEVLRSRFAYLLANH